MKTPAFFLLVLFTLNLSSCNGQEKRPGSESVTDLKSETTIEKSEDEWRKMLSPQQFHILREKGTDRPFTGKYYRTTDAGVYECAACGNELFTSDMKFDSDCGWPSFDRAVEGGRIKTAKDLSHGMVRTEILCARCGGHLGHLFEDGPTSTGLRYCVNSTSLNFIKEEPAEEKN
jgi:peptide-methionine (R)-S-oxide reductase